MIIVKLKGGLGNQMFQYALGRHLALRNRTKLVLDVSSFKYEILRDYALHMFTISARPASQLELRLRTFISSKLGMSYCYLEEKDMRFDKDIFAKKGNIYLDGYWQCEGYFKDIGDILVKDFTIKVRPDIHNKSMLEKIDNSNSICLHIRRGDYVNDVTTREFHGTCSLNYYYNSIEKIERHVENLIIFVFSDDIRWVKENLKTNHPTVYVDINSPERCSEDLLLMSHCKHFVIANSSFSWWAAWLSRNPDKVICAPEKWFNAIDEGDIVPKSWRRIKG